MVHYLEKVRLLLNLFFFQTQTAYSKVKLQHQVETTKVDF